MNIQNLKELFSQHGPLRWMAWLVLGVMLHLALIVVKWLVFREIDLSNLNPWTYSPHAFFIAIMWYWGFLYLWIIE
jgi:hypothetical protein